VVEHDRHLRTPIFRKAIVGYRQEVSASVARAR
jgi:hypothetical protein